MAVNVIKRTWLQDRMVRPETLNGMVFQEEAGAHRFEITGYDSNGNVMAFSGTVTAIFLRPDNTDVPLTGVISNGVAQVTLSQECYQVPGRFGLAIFVNIGNTKTVVYKCIGPVGMTSSGVEASSVVQSVNTLIDRIEAAINSIPQDYSALSKSVSATCPEMRDGSTGNPWNTDSITTKYVIKIDKSCDELILEYIGSTQAQYYVFGYSVFNGVADGTESYAARTSAASFLDYPEKYVQTEPYVIIPVSQLGDYTHIAIVLWAKSDETTFIPLRIATEQNNLRVTFRHASYMGHEEINNRSVKVGVQNASKMASPLKLVHFSDLHRDVNALNRIRASAKYVCPNADNIICTGDMVANTYAEITSWWIPEIMTCIGNHDTASYDGTYDWTALTMAQRDEMYISPFKSYWGIVHTAGTSYYYKDYTAAHIRLIVMDAMLYSGTPGAEATAQTQWLANLLVSAITDSLHVIIAIHAPHGGSVPVECSFTKLGQETMPVNVDCNTPDVVINTVATAIGNGLHFIGYICGHTHQDAVWDCTGDRSQLMYTVTCAAVDQTAQWANSDQYRSEELDAFNVLTIDTASTTIKILRGGGANTDVALRPRVSMVINYSTGKIITDTYASGTQDAVVYGEAQDLTDAQKAQARANIGAGSAADVSENTADITANTNEITNLKSAIGYKAADIGSYNRFDKSSATAGKIINKQGTIIDGSANWGLSDYIPVIPGMVLYASGNSAANYALFDANFDVVSNSSDWANPFTVPSNVYYLRITFATSTISTAYVSTIDSFDTYKNIENYLHDSVSGLDGRVSVIENTMEGLPGAVSDLQDDVGTLETDTTGIQKTVNDALKLSSLFSVSGALNKNYGTVGTNPSYACTDFIPLQGIRTPFSYTVKTYSSIAIACLYDENKSFIPGSSIVSENSSLTEESGIISNFQGAYYIRFCSYIYQYTPVLYVAKVQDAVLYGKTVEPGNIAFSVHDPATNLIDKSKLSLGYINGNTDGSVHTSTTMYCTDYIPLEAGKQYYFNGNYLYKGYCAFYNSNKEYISGYGASSASVYLPSPFTAPLNTAFARFTIASESRIANAWLCETNQMSTKPADYNIEIPDRFVSERPTDYIGNEICVFNKILCIGDSLTEGFFNESGRSRLIMQNRSYPAKLKALTGIETTNMGHSGYTSAEWYAAYSTADISGHDACIIQLGVNDALHNVSESDMDVALENIITKVKNENNGIKIFVATIVPGNGYMTSAMVTRSQMIRDFVSSMNDPQVYLVDLWRYAHTDDNLAYDAGHLSALGYLRLAEDYKAYIGWIIHNNIMDYRYVQFTGTNYTYSGDTEVRAISY